ncbi:MAG: M56 family metallopeptidase [Catenulispora sp.]|nr:M56 family metallopeptidase [Catenulispora sp.]
MIAALILCTYAVAVALFAPALLERFWPSDRAPRLTVLLLQTLSCSFLAASVGAGLALALTLVEGLSELSPALDRCADTLPVGEHSSVTTWVGHVGLVSAGALVLRVLYCLLVTFGRARLRRRAHLKVLRMLATRDERLGVLVLDHPAPACYCLPGDIVITTGALSCLSESQLEAVLLHERAHVAGHHHVIIALAAAIGRTVPRVRLLTYAERETRRLVELIADDAAVARTSAPAVAAALAVIGTGHAPDLDPTAAPMPVLAAAGVAARRGSSGSSSDSRLNAASNSGSVGRASTDSSGVAKASDGETPAPASQNPGGGQPSSPIPAPKSTLGIDSPPSILGADSSPTLRRVRRLLRLDRALTGRARALSLVAAVFMIALPITLLGVSGASLISHCPPDTEDHDARSPNPVVTASAPLTVGTVEPAGTAGTAETAEADATFSCGAEDDCWHHQTSSARLQLIPSAQ